MLNFHVIVALIVIAFISFKAGTFFIGKLAKKPSNTSGHFSKPLYSLPRYYGYCTIIWSLVPVLAILLILNLTRAGIVNTESVTISPYLIPLIVLSAIFTSAAVYMLKPSFNARRHFESWVKYLFLGCSVISVSITIFIFASVLFESLKFFDKVNVFDFLFGLQWSPQTALRADQAGSSGAFGIIPVFLGTFVITSIAMLVALPLGLLSAIYMSEYSRPRFRNIVKPVLEILAGIPTVVYGYFAAITMGPALRDFFAHMNIEVASESALAAGLVMGIMIIPFIMSLSDDVMNAVPRSLREASLGLGATQSETIRKVVLPAALPGIMGAFLLAVSRAIGETMIVVMAAGLIATLSISPLDSVTTVTAQIVRLLVGDQEFDSAKTLSAFALSLTLFLITLVLNVAAIIIVKKYREKYE